MNRVELIKNELIELKEKWYRLMDQADAIKNSRESKGLSKAILKCNDIEAIELINVYNELNNIELKEDQLHEELKNIRYEEHKENCKIEQANYIDNKYRVNIVDNGNITIAYTNDIEEYKSIRDRNITIMEYIEYNNTIDKTINIPVLKTIYSYNKEYNCIVNNTVNQSNNMNYKEEYINLDNGNRTIRIYLLDSNNTYLGFYESDYISISELTGLYSHDNINITHRNDSARYYITKGSTNNTVVNDLNKDITDRINKTLIKLKNNKSYNYNIDEIKELLGI